MPLRRLILGSLVAPLLGSATAAEAPPRVTHAVLVHGIWQAKWRCFGFLRHDLEARGVRCLVPSLKPADGRDGIGVLAQQLKAEIDREFGPDQEFLLVGFSMGGLVSRTYLQHLGGAPRCVGFATISTPHHGTEMARFHYGKGAAQMRPDSVFLHDLNHDPVALSGIPMVSYRTPLDAVIVPSESSVWELADNVSVPAPLHPLMTFSPTVRKDLLARFRYPD